jgi:hypothetical protein
VCLDEARREELTEISRLDGLELAPATVATSTRPASWGVDHGLKPDFTDLSLWVEAIFGGWIEY